MCTECMGWGEGNPKECTDTQCPLYPYRGKSQAAYNPQPKKTQYFRGGNAGLSTIKQGEENADNN